MVLYAIWQEVLRAHAFLARARGNEKVLYAIWQEVLRALASLARARMSKNFMPYGKKDCGHMPLVLASSMKQ
jgi:hypothetical protein